MNSKINLAVFALLFSLVFIGLVSAASFSVSPSSLIFSQTANSTTLTITNSNSSQTLNLTFSSFIIAGEGTYQVLFPSANLNNISTTKTIAITSSSAIDFSNFKLGKSYSSSMLVSNTNNSNDNLTAPVTIQKSFCKSGDIGTNLSLTDVTIDNKDGDDTDWMPLDEIEIEIEISNENSDSGAKIDTDLELGLYNSDGKEKLDLNKVKVGKIKEDDSETKTITFEVPADLDDGTYYLYIKAYQSGKEDKICTSKFDSEYRKLIDISREDDEKRQVVLTDTVFEPATGLCNNEVTLRTKAVNIGEDDQEEVKVKIMNKELGVDMYKILDNFDKGDDAVIEFTFKIPQNAPAKTYVLDLINLYTYDDNYNAEDDRAYDDFSDNFFANLKVECTAKPLADAEISASLVTPEENIKAGNELIIKATIKNTGDEKTSYIISLEGSEDFSTVQSISPTTFSLNKGESKDVSINLKLNGDAEGEKVFDIIAGFNGNEVKQAISLIIPQSTSSITGSAIADSLKQNWVIWLIVLINVILIILIIVVAVRMARA